MNFRAFSGFSLESRETCLEVNFRGFSGLLV